MKKTYIMCLLLLSALCPSAAEAVTYKLAIRQHNETVTLTNQRADQILTIMGNILMVSDHPGDAACDAKFTRQGDIGLFDSTEIPYSINSQADFRTMSAAPGSVKVVGEINWCSTFTPNIVGCATRPGRGLSVVRYLTNGPAKLEGIIWAHEFSHTTGNPHRDFSTALMHPSIALTHLDLNNTECSAIQHGSAAAAGTASPAIADGEPEVHTAQADTSAVPMPVEDFVEALWFEGTPYNLAAQYTIDDVPKLEAILGDESAAPSWPTAIATLGAIGGDRAREILTDVLLKHPSGPMSATEYATRSNVLVALGWLAAKDGDPQATGLLIDATNYDFWASVIEDGNWISEVHADADELIESLIAKALIGLSLSGTEEATKRLQGLADVASGKIQSKPNLTESTAIRERIGPEGLDALLTIEEPTLDAIRENGGSDFLNEQIQALEQIKAGGLSAYYQ